MKIMEIKYSSQKGKYGDACYYGQVRLSASNQAIKHGLGLIYYNQSKYYEGEWEDNHRHGEGFEEFENHNTYKGSYKKGKAHGMGVYKWSNGEIYKGNWKDGLRHGKGKWTGVGRDSYEGDWKEGKAHGFGVHIWKNGKLNQTPNTQVIVMKVIGGTATSTAMVSTPTPVETNTSENTKKADSTEKADSCGTQE